MTKSEEVRTVSLSSWNCMRTVSSGTLARERVHQCGSGGKLSGDSCVRLNKEERLNLIWGKL
ncbi:MAG: hypothetical protein ACLTR6_06655 [Clostridium fessum]